MEAQQIDSTEQEVQTADEPKTPTLKDTLQAAMNGEDKLPEPPAEPMQEVQAEELEQTEEVAEQVEEKAPVEEEVVTEEPEYGTDEYWAQKKAERSKKLGLTKSVFNMYKNY